MDLMMAAPRQTSASIAVRLRQKWSELLEVAECEVTSCSDFFGLGGNSMLLLSLHAFVSQEFNTGLALLELFENATFADMEHLLRNRIADTG